VSEEPSESRQVRRRQDGVREAPEGGAAIGSG